jgi:hypothetical protein
LTLDGEPEVAKSIRIHWCRVSHERW